MIDLAKKEKEIVFAKSKGKTRGEKKKRVKKEESVEKNKETSKFL
jgi:hypothetical protein